MQARLFDEIERVAGRYRQMRIWTALAIVWFAASAVAAGVLLLDRLGWAAPRWSVPVLAIAAVAGAIVAAWQAARPTRDQRWIARRIEGRYPELDSLLLAAVEQSPNLPGGRFGFLQEQVLRSAIHHGRSHDWEDHVVSRWRLRATEMAGALALALLAASLAMVSQTGRKHALALPSDEGPVGWLGGAAEPVVTPGDTEIERGAALVVTARFRGRLPDEAALVYRPPGGEAVRLRLSPSLSDPMFGGRIDSVQGELTYHVEYGRRKTREYRVTVFEFPELVQADAELRFPDYTGLGEKRIEDTRRVTAVEGTRLTMWCRLNKPVCEARLVGEGDRQIELASTGEDRSVRTFSVALAESGRYRLYLVDDQGRANKEPPEFVFTVTPNRRPEIRVEAPARDVRVSPIEELEAKAQVWDDFGLVAYGLSYSLAGGPATDVPLGQKAEGGKRHPAVTLVDFEALGAEPDQLLSYYFWAEDNGADGEPRRTMGDMYFAEVRHFEEIFREGEQPAGDQSQQQQQQQGGNAQQAEQLAEQQKQVINATWKVLRRETAARSDALVTDSRRVHEAQQAVVEAATALSERLEDPESNQHLDAAVAHMGEAIDQLAKVLDSKEVEPLTPALAAEQAAYQALLKLRAREHLVTRGRQQQQPGQSQANSSGPSQQQLNQLELKQSENRYETKRSPEQQPADQATREVLNRLRDLARRQDDLNERLKELQSALEEAKTPEEREEVERQLKRLREQQQEMLRDTDELAERMGQPENQERMSEARQQLEQTRRELQQASEALQQGQLSEAQARGTRAERDLEQMADDFRQQASNRFADEMQELREEARRLHENETKLGEQLRNLDRPEAGPKSLRQDNRRQDVTEAFQQQSKDLTELMKSMQETVEQAEEAEPLMADKLYDALRSARQERLEEKLEMSRTLLDRGFLQESAQVEALASEGIEQLKEGVEDAATSVLGDELEALRRARDELDDLARQLDQEMRQASGRPSDEQTPADSDRQSLAQAGAEPGGQEQPEQDQPGQDQQARTAADGSPQEEPADEEPNAEAEMLRELAEAAGQARRGDRPNGPGEPQRRALRPQPGQSPETLSPSDQARAEGESREEADQAGGARPMSGDDFADWSGRLRDVEEMLDDAELRAEAARIRQQARGIRQQVRGGSKGPEWDLVRMLVAEPLEELRDRVIEELARRTPERSMVPIDRDPVPPRYAEQVRRYYERLGRGE